MEYKSSKNVEPNMRKPGMSGFVYFKNSDIAVNLDTAVSIRFYEDRMIIDTSCVEYDIVIRGEDYDDFCFHFFIKKPSPTPQE